MFESSASSIKDESMEVFKKQIKITLGYKNH